MSERILQNVVVLGAGTMGARIAAHCANHGLRVTLLDLPSPAPHRNAIAEAGLQAALQSRPASFFDPGFAPRVAVGNFDDDLSCLREADWVIEAVIENLGRKHELLRRMAPFVAGHAAVTTNTSGLPVAEVGAVLPAALRRRWFGTHFFNPPRYLRLVEVIPTSETDPAMMAWVGACIDQRLGKGIVPALDTPNFIANRIGTFALLNTLRLMREFKFNVDEIDFLTGPPLGWPKSATFRTLDLVGIDTLAHVVRNSYANLPQDECRELFQVPAVIEAMLQRGWLGDKTGHGFYRKAADDDGATTILTLNLETWQYEPRRRAHFPALAGALALEDADERLRQAVRADDAGGRFLWKAMSDLMLYSAHRIPEIADSAAEVDRAMRWGYGWQWGPFELWDRLGFEAVAERLQREERPLPRYAQHAAQCTPPGFYRWNAPSGPESRLEAVTAPAYDYAPVRQPAGTLSLEALGRSGRMRVRNASCSLIDLGLGVGGLEFHSKLNTINGDVVALVTETLRAPQSEFDAFVIGNEAEQFSAGADLLYLLVCIQNEDWDEIRLAVQAFQGMNLAVKRCRRPVVVAPAGLALGGGCEMLLHSGAAVAAAELYTGLVEVGVGLIPAGGGATQMALRASAAGQAGGAVGMQEAYKAAFETIALAKISGSANEARQLGYLRPADLVVANRERVLFTAREHARALADLPYAPAAPQHATAPGPSVLATLQWGLYLMRAGGRITDFEHSLGQRLLKVLCADGAPAGTPVREETLLELEQEAFLSLCGEARTKERIAHMLKTGKALRN